MSETESETQQEQRLQKQAAFMARRMNLPNLLTLDWMRNGELRYSCPIPMAVKIMTQDWSELLHMVTANQDLTINAANKDYLEKKPTFELFQDIETYYVAVERRAEQLKQQQPQASTQPDKVNTPNDL